MTAVQMMMMTMMMLVMGDADAEDEPFKDLLNDAKANLGEKDVSHEALQKPFREEYIDHVLWYRRLRKHPIHKKVMETAKELRTGSEDYDYEESLEAAVDQRKFLLNRFVPEPEPVDAVEDESMDEGAKQYDDAPPKSLGPYWLGDPREPPETSFP